LLFNNGNSLKRDPNSFSPVSDSLLGWHIEMNLALLWAAASRILPITAADLPGAGITWARCAVALAVLLGA